MQTPIATLPFTVQFNQTDGTRLGAAWNQLTGTFSVKNSALVSQGPGIGLATLFGLSQANVTVSADIALVPLGGFAGVVSRYNTVTGNLYRGGIAATRD